MEIESKKDYNIDSNGENNYKYSENDISKFWNEKNNNRNKRKIKDFINIKEKKANFEKSKVKNTFENSGYKDGEYIGYEDNKKEDCSYDAQNIDQNSEFHTKENENNNSKKKVNEK